jgi:twitching motility protein PilT
MNELLEKLIELKGSDLHLIAGLYPHVRVDGILNPLTEYEKLSPQMVKELVYSILNDEQKSNFEKDMKQRYELDFAHGVPGLGRFRVNVHKQRGTVAATVRGLADRVPKLTELGLPESIKDFAAAIKGLILVTGPSGSGKSTTLAAIIDEINNNRNVHVITVEDPIEYLHNTRQAAITQREVGFHADTLSFKNAIKYALRQDPDVIMIGEMRDFETINVAITSAETGHLVLGTMHTASAAETVDRIIDVFPSEQQAQIRIQLASIITGVISQILLPRIDAPGRCVACEVMMAHPAIREHIRTGKTKEIYPTIQTSEGEGMQTIEQSLIKLSRQGKVDFETAKPYLKGYSKFEFMQLVKNP